MCIKLTFSRLTVVGLRSLKQSLETELIIYERDQYTGICVSFNSPYDVQMIACCNYITVTLLVKAYMYFINII